MKKQERVVVIGASINPERYSYRATIALKNAGHIPIPVGLRAGEISGVEILTGTPSIPAVDSVTLYLGEARQPVIYDYILRLMPKRIIFNPGTENEELKDLAAAKGIESIEACTLVMLSVGNF
ncbi:MAG: CoA-binding protein [Salibacteraceae bacterium]|nr:CoA-binding protein [Salibacteraceae bacterium]|tara:strand:- start:12094 stop:12462 length:369 start_codon:yes stop_codon:yes gene_type:complete